MMNTKTLLILLTAILAGCSTVTTPPNIIIKQEPICQDPPKASPIVMRQVKPTVIKDELGVYWIGLTPDDYENISLNMSDIIAHLKQKNTIIRYYKQCTDDARQRKDSKTEQQTD